jgi:hypothetical protein
MSRRCVLFAILPLFLMLQSLSATAAEMKAEKISNETLYVVRVNGVLERRDDEKFIGIVARLPLLFVIVIFNSPGGDLNSGLAIGHEIKLRGLSTAVEAGAVCASACALAWLAGDTRYMEASSKIGFHAAYVTQGQTQVEKGEANALVGAYLNQVGMSSDAIRYITRAPPSGVQWLSIRHSMTLGINVTIPSEVSASK